MEALMMAAGAAVSLIGGMGGAEASSSYYKTQQDIGSLEGKVNDQRKAAMEVDARRRQLEVVRNNQRARSLAETSATSQGSQFGSGLQGAYGGISGQSNTNLTGINQNLEIGRNIFGLDTQISADRIAASGYQSQMNTDKAMGQLGGALMGSAGKVGQMSQGMSNPFSMFTSGFGSGDPG